MYIHTVHMYVHTYKLRNDYTVCIVFTVKTKTNYLEKKSVIHFCLADVILDLAAVSLHFFIHKTSIGVEVGFCSMY